MIPVNVPSKIVKLIETERRMAVVRGGAGNGELLVNVEWE